MGRSFTNNGIISVDEASEMLNDLKSYPENTLAIKFNNPIDGVWADCEIWYDPDDDNFELCYYALDEEEDVFTDSFENVVELIAEDSAAAGGATADFV